jgi:hypothetical protein
MRRTAADAAVAAAESKLRIGDRLLVRMQQATVCIADGSTKRVVCSVVRILYDRLLVRMQQATVCIADACVTCLFVLRKDRSAHELTFNHVFF